APRPFGSVGPLSCRSTPSVAGCWALAFTRCATHLRSRYTPTVSAANKQATAADQLACLAASLLVMLSVKPNLGRLYTKAAGHDSRTAAPMDAILRLTLCFWLSILTQELAGNRSSGNQGNCTWPGPFVSAERFPHGCSCRDRICIA